MGLGLNEVNAGDVFVSEMFSEESSCVSLKKKRALFAKEKIRTPYHKFLMGGLNQPMLAEVLGFVDVYCQYGLLLK